MRLPIPGRLVDRYVCGCSLPLAQAQPFLPHFFSVATSEPRINPSNDPNSAMSASLVAAAFDRFDVFICNSLCSMLLSIPYTRRRQMQAVPPRFVPRTGESGGSDSDGGARRCGVSAVAGKNAGGHGENKRGAVGLYSATARVYWHRFGKAKMADTPRHRRQPHQASSATLASRSPQPFFPCRICPAASSPGGGDVKPAPRFFRWGAAFFPATAGRVAPFRGPAAFCAQAIVPAVDNGRHNTRLSSRRSRATRNPLAAFGRPIGDQALW